MVYLYYLEDTKSMGSRNDMRLNRLLFVAKDPLPPSVATTRFGSVGPHTKFQLYEKSVQDSLWKIKAYKKYERSLPYLGCPGIPYTVQNAFEDYQDTYMTEIPCHCKHNHCAPAAVRISRRGNLGEGMPFLALTCRQILGEMWAWCFSTTPAMATKNTAKRTKEGIEHMTKSIRYTAIVLNFKFAPLYRFLQMLRRLPGGIHVQGEMVDIVLKDDDEEYGTCAKKYDKVKRLIESHWLDDLPLWGSWTDIRAEADLKNKPRQERRAKEVFGESIYSVHQVVALYHIKRGTWRELSVEYLNLWDVFEGNDDKERRQWGTCPKAEIVEAIIALLSDTTEYRCGWLGNWGYGKDNKTCQDYDPPSRGWLRPNRFFDQVCLRPQQLANELEHAKVHMANQYCLRVGKLLRDELGSLYGDWEKLEDKKRVPMDILL
jgi:hypothetical protein